MGEVLAQGETVVISKEKISKKPSGILTSGLTHFTFNSPACHPMTRANYQEDGWIQRQHVGYT